MSRRLARRLPFFYGWLVVAGVFVLCMPMSGLAFYGLSVYLRALSRERGFSIASVSGATALSYALSGVVGMLIARRVARADPRPLIAIGAVASGIALAGVGRATQEWHVFALYGLLGASTALNSLVIGTTLVTRWFHRRRGLALALATSGLTTGGLVVAPIASALIEGHGLAWAMPRLGLLYVALAVPVPLLLLVREPAALDLLPDGDRPSPVGVSGVGGSGVGASGVAEGGARPAASWSYAEAIRSRAFLTITATLVCSQLAQVGGISQLFNAASSRVDEATGRLCLMLVTSVGVAGRLLGGPLAARLTSRRFALGCYAAQGLGWAAVAAAHSRPALIGAAVLTGLTVGNTLLLHPLLLSEYFGPRDYSRIYALSQLIVTVGVAGGPFALGWVHDHAGGYGAAYGLAAGSAALGALLFTFGWSGYVPAEEFFRAAPVEMATAPSSS